MDGWVRAVGRNAAGRPGPQCACAAPCWRRSSRGGLKNRRRPLNLPWCSGSRIVRRAMSAGGAVSGDAEGFAQFIEAREQALQRTAWLLTNDWALAQDLVQTALARSWPYWGRIERGDDPEIYVRRVMVNAWATWRRRRWRAEEPAGLLTDGPDPRDMAADVATRVAVRQLLAALGRLWIGLVRRLFAAVWYRSSTLAGMRPRSLTAMPWSFAHARMSALRRRPS